MAEKQPNPHPLERLRKEAYKGVLPFFPFLFLQETIMPESDSDTLKCRNCGVNNGPCPDECKASYCLVTLTNPPLPEPDAEFLAYLAKDAGRYPDAA